MGHFDLAGLARDGVDSQHVQIEAMKLAFADVYRYIADPRSMQVQTEQLLDPQYLAQRARLIDLHQAQDFGAGNPVIIGKRLAFILEKTGQTKRL